MRIQALRDLTRTRKQLVREVAQHSLRIQKVLEDANLKVASVLSNILGKSGRAMLAALIAGETDPERLAALAQGTARQKHAALGMVRAHCRKGPSARSTRSSGPAGLRATSIACLATSMPIHTGLPARAVRFPPCLHLISQRLLRGSQPQKGPVLQAGAAPDGVCG